MESGTVRAHPYVPRELNTAIRVVGFMNIRQLTMRARGRRDSHRQNELVLALSSSVSQPNPSPPAADNANR